MLIGYTAPPYGCKENGTIRRWVSIGRDNLFGGVSAVSGAALNRAVFAAVVWGDTGSVDDVYVVFSGVFVSWICLCPFADTN